MVTKMMVYEETFVSVWAQNQEMANLKIENYGKACQDQYLNDKGEELVVEFIKIGKVEQVLYKEEDPNEVNEIFIRSFETFEEYFKYLI